MKSKFLFVMLTVLNVLSASIFAQKDTSSIELNEIIISTGRVEQSVKKLTASTSILNRSDIDLMPLNTIDEALRASIGINIVRPFGLYGKSNVSIRGFGGNEQGRVLILQDGVPINKSDLGDVNWNRINPLSVSKIEILRGPGSSVYGSNAMGGIINLITQEYSKKPFSGTAKISYGTFNTLSSAVNISGSPFKNKKLTYNINSFYRNSDGYISQVDSLSDSTHIASWLEEFGVNVSGAYSFNNNNKLDFTYNYYNDKRSQGIRIFDETGNAVDHDTHFFRSKYSGKNKKMSWNANIYFQNEHYFRVVESLKKSYALYYVNSYRNDLGFIGNLSYKTKRNVLSIGFDFIKGLVTGADEYQTSTDIIRNIGDVNSFSAFIYDNFEIADNFFINAAMHYDNILLKKSEFVLENPSENSDILIPYESDITGNNWNTFSPKLSFLYLKNRHKVYVSYSTGFRAPTIDDLTRTGFIAGGFKLANSNLHAEKVNNFEFGSSLNNNKLTVHFTAYYTLGYDFMYYTETGDFIFGSKPILIKQNITNVELYGAEASADYKFNKMVQAFLNYSYGRNSIKNFEEDPELTGKILTYSPEHKINFGIVLKTKIIDFSGSFNYLSEQFINDANTQEIPEQFLLNLKFIKTFKFGLLISASVQNLLDKQYLLYSEQLSIGRFSIFSLAYKF